MKRRQEESDVSPLSRSRRIRHARPGIPTSSGWAAAALLLYLSGAVLHARPAGKLSLPPEFPQ